MPRPRAFAASHVVSANSLEDSTRVLKRFLIRATLVLLGVIVAVVAAEIALRLVFPVRQPLNTMPVNEANPVARYEPNKVVTYSKGWNFSLANVVKVNNFGFVSNIDYDEESTTPLLAIIGDSYVEALMVPTDETGGAKLAELLGGIARVYTFGKSGAPLSQYLIYAEYARDTFSPDAMAIVVVSNDFDRSLTKYTSSSPSWHRFVENHDGALELVRYDFSPSWKHRAVRKSALAMYLTANLKLKELRLPWGSRGQAAVKGTAGDTRLNEDPRAAARITDSKRAVDEFFSQLPTRSGLSTSRIALVVDGLRPEVYEDSQPNSSQGRPFDVMRRYLMDAADSKGYVVIDMQPIFMNHYKTNGNRFEFPNDFHWNSLGHELFADALAHSPLIAYLTDPHR